MKRDELAELTRRGRVVHDLGGTLVVVWVWRRGKPLCVLVDLAHDRAQVRDVWVAFDGTAAGLLACVP